MSIENLAEQAVAFSVPLAMEFRSSHSRQGVVFSGPNGWGEFAPFADYSDELAGRWLAGALELAFGNLPKLERTEVPVNAIIPATDEVTAFELVQKAVQNFGVTTIKVKVAQTGQNLADDVARVRAVRSALVANGVPDGKVRLDVNGGWSLDQAKTAVPALTKAAGELEYLEQPCADLSDIAELRKATDTQIAIDEALRQVTELDILAIRDAADLLVVKSIPLGGVNATLRLIDRLDMPVVVSGSMDTSVGLYSALHLAGSVPELAGACGLGTGTLLALDLVPETSLPKNGVMEVVRTIPDSHCLAVAHALTTQEMRDYWRNRIVSAWYASAKEIVAPEIKHAVLSC